MKYLINFIFLIGVFSCKQQKDAKEQSISLRETTATFDTSSGISSSNNFTQLNTTPNDLVLTGNDKIRLLPIYKIPPSHDKNILYDQGTSFDNEKEILKEDDYRYYMPGIDIIKGYNLVNIGHYNSDKGLLSYFFKKPVLVRTLYFPGVHKDSLGKKEVNRNFFLVSVYNEDTNHDSLINNKDYRRLFYFDILNETQISLLPTDYSAIRSSYDFKNDIMTIRARKDENKNGDLEKSEPISIFLLDFKNPTILKQVY
ncbi:hypothetical protein QUB36_30545 [Microcoleus sp. AT8-B1]|jgi:hypothetical protein|uniref:hypothetical protein n=1 Tax=Microcoleus sp. AT8-B1 TaxID=2818617 RepID=UPI002FD7184C